MALSSTLFTGLSGLVVNQSQLNVVGNNIANANTTAFKASRTIFSPQFYETLSTGSPANGTSGGSNPSQIGLGAQVAAIQQNFSQGELQTTGQSNDLAIDGSGFFVVKNDNGSQLYTRNGAFQLNSNNQLTDTGGDFVLGYPVNSGFQVVSGNPQPITIPIGGGAGTGGVQIGTLAKPTSNAAITGNLDSGGVVGTTGAVLTSQTLTQASGVPIDGTTFLTDLVDVATNAPVYNAGDVISVSPQQGGRSLPTKTLDVTGGTTVQDLQDFFNAAMNINTTLPAGSTDPAPGVSLTTVTGGQQLTITGNVGTANDITIPIGKLSNSPSGTTLSFAKTSAANGESVNTPITGYDSLGNPIAFNVTAVLTSKTNTGTGWEFFVSSQDNKTATAAGIENPAIQVGTLNFNNDGQLTAFTGDNFSLNRTGTGATANQQIALDFSGTQALAGATSSLVSPSQDGFAQGTLSSYNVGADGTITGTYSNGLTETIGQIAMASFQNPAGLVNQGGSLYSAGASSGSAQITAPQQQGNGTIKSGELEMSNVDLSQEFINLIIASTGYSASSKVVTTSDQLLTALLNTAR